MLFKLHVLSCVCICICDAISALGAPCAFTDEVKDSQLAAIQEKSASLFKESKSLFPRYLHGSVNRFHSLALGTCVHYYCVYSYCSVAHRQSWLFSRSWIQWHLSGSPVSPRVNIGVPLSYVHCFSEEDGRLTSPRRVRPIQCGICSR